MAHDPQPLKHLMPGWYAAVMGLAGLALAWHRAQPVMGEMAAGFALVIGMLALLAFLALALASWRRWALHREAWAEDWRHPVRHPFFAAMPISVILLATLAVALLGPSEWARALWWLGAVAQFIVTLLVMRRWWRPASTPAGGLPWPSVTPALFIPVVGNVLVPLAGVPLGHEGWSAAQFGIGLLYWPVVLALILVRIAQQGLWPARLLPSGFVFVAPPAVCGIAFLQFGAGPLVAWACWGMALFSLVWAASLLPQLKSQPFAVPHWAMGFPLAAFAALSMRLATPGSAMAVLAVVALALASLVILMLCMATVRGLRQGTLLVPEPVAAIQPVAAP